jgi:hypothetical protein
MTTEQTPRSCKRKALVGEMQEMGPGQSTANHCMIYSHSRRMPVHLSTKQHQASSISGRATGVRPQVAASPAHGPAARHAVLGACTRSDWVSDMRPG